MRLIYRILARVSLALLPILAIWAAIFYMAMVNAINDEADDALENYSELVIKRMLAGRELPQPENGSNNTYTITPIDISSPEITSRIEYRSERVYIPDKNETEPARVLMTIFRDAQNNYYRLEVKMPTFEREDLFETISLGIIYLYVILLITVVTLTVFVVNRSMRPLYSLLRWLDAYNLGHTSSRMVPNESNTKEFLQLSVAAQNMVNRAENVYERQREFVGNASHELQTPIAILGNRIEWLIDNTPLNEQQLSELIKMQRTIGHINRLNKTLLMLSRIDNGQFPDSTTFDLQRLIVEQLDSCSEVNAAKHLKVTSDNIAPCRVTMNETLAQTMISNLLRNAYTYTSEGGEIQVTLTDRTLVIANSGSEPLDGEQIFDRFYRGNNRREGSTGLGLALVSAICHYYTIPVWYSFERGLHHFTVQLDAVSGDTHRH